MSFDAPKNIVIAPDAAVYENAPCLQKVEAAVIQQGIAASVQWELRDNEGFPLDLGGIFYEPECVPPPSCDYSNPKLGASNTLAMLMAGLNNDYYTRGCNKPPSENYFIQVRIQPADEPQWPMWVETATVRNAKEGIIEFQVPNKVADLGGIYVLNIGICRECDNRPLYVHRGLLCVERSAWRPPNVDCKMPTLSDVRMRILDSDTENLLQGYVEFTTSDILDSIVSAVREWNGTTPNLENYTFTCYNFPWIEPWLNKVTASLYQKATLRYGRNKLMVSHGGVQGDDLNRDQFYQAVSQQHDQLWKEWLTVKKRELNLQQFSGVVSSPYARIPHSVRGRTR